MVKKFIELFLAALDLELQKKTGWGRNEIKEAVQKAINTAALELLE